MLRHHALPAASFVLLLALAAPSAAQPPVPPESYAELIERLRAAEARLADLESRSVAPVPAAPGAADAPFEPPGRATLPPAAPASEFVADPADSLGDDSPQPTDSAADATARPAAEFLERLNALGTDLDSLKEFRTALDDAKAASNKKPTFKIGGRIHADYWTFPQTTPGINFFEHPDPGDPQFGTDPEDRFLFRRIRLETQGEIPDLMLYRLQIDFNQPQDPQFKDVYLGFQLPGNQTLLIGNQKRPIGLDHLNSSRFNVFLERPLAVEAFNVDARRLGIAMYGYDDDLLFNWRYGVYNLQDVQNLGIYRGDSLQLGAYGRLASTPWYDESSGGRGYLHLGIAGSVARPDGDAGPADTNVNEARFFTRAEGRSDSRWLDTGRIAGATAFEQLGLESVLNIGALQLTGEYLTTAVQRDGTTAGTGPDTLFHGGYVYASYFLTGEFMPWDRTSGTLDRPKPLENFFLAPRCPGPDGEDRGTVRGWGAWQVAAKYSYLDLTDADIRGGVQHDVTLGLNWWWNPYAHWQANVTRGFIDDHRPVGPGLTEGDFLLAGVRFAVDF